MNFDYLNLQEEEIISDIACNEAHEEVLLSVFLFDLYYLFISFIKFPVQDIADFGIQSHLLCTVGEIVNTLYVFTLSFVGIPCHSYLVGKLVICLHEKEGK